MKHLYTQVVVVGGGPAGATASRILSQSNVETVLVEKNLQNSKPCGGGLISTAFDEFDIPKSLIKKQVEKVRIVSPSDLIVDIPLEGGFLAIVDRKEFDNTLRTIASNKGVELIEGEFRSLYYQNGKPSVTILTNKEALEISAEYIIAADGVNSRIRKQLTGSFPLRFFSLSELLPDYNTEACELWFGSSIAPRFYAWVFPSSRGVDIGTIKANPVGIKTCFNNFLKKRELHSSKRPKGFFIPEWNDNLYFKKKVFFAGDSAAQVLPFTLEGIYYAMKSAEFVATAILQDKPALYKKLWRSAFKKRFLLMKTLHKIFLKDDTSVEKLIKLYKEEEIMQASMRLWLRKDPKQKILISYISLLKKFLDF